MSEAAKTFGKSHSGLGGIGKTQLALEYAYRYGAEYQAVLWVQADTIEALTSSLVELAPILKLPEAYKHDREIIIQSVLNWFRFHSNWLLIYDNVEDFSLVEPFLPNTGPRYLLFTTRTRYFKGAAQFLEAQAHELRNETRFSSERASQAYTSVPFVLDKGTVISSTLQKQTRGETCPPAEPLSSSNS